MQGRGPKSKGQRSDDESSTEQLDPEEQKARERGGEIADLPVADPDPEAQPDGDPGPDDAKKAGC